MGAIGGLLGFEGGASGSGFGGPGGYSQGVSGILNPVSVDQAHAAQNASLGSMGGQQALLQALQAQNGLGNQSSVFNQLQSVASGGGPNPAQQQFQNNANQLGAQSAGLMGSQKGMSPALQARMVAQQGAGAQQNVAGQGAQATANQQLGALSAMGNMANQQAGNQIGQTNANTAASQNQQQMLLNAIGQQNNANAGLQSNVNSTNATLANTQMQGQQGMLGGIMSGFGSMSSMMGGGGGSSGGGSSAGMAAMMSDERVKKNVAEFDSKEFLGSIEPHQYEYKDPSMGAGKQVGVMAQDVEKTAPQLVSETPEGKQIDYNKAGGPILASLADINERLSRIEGGKVAMADGGMVPAFGGGPQSMFGQFVAAKPGVGGPSIEMPQLRQGPSSFGGGLGGMGGANPKETPKSDSAKSPEKETGIAPMAGTSGDYSGVQAMAAKGGQVNALVSPGELWLPPDAVGKVMAGRNPMKAGERIPGKPKVKGDSYANDTVPKKLDVGGIVIPNSIMQSKNPAQGAKDFVAKIIAKRRGKK